MIRAILWAGFEQAECRVGEFVLRAEGCYRVGFESQVFVEMGQQIAHDSMGVMEEILGSLPVGLEDLRISSLS